MITERSLVTTMQRRGLEFYRKARKNIIELKLR
jgi:hypothetical protein